MNNLWRQIECHFIGLSEVKMKKLEFSIGRNNLDTILNQIHHTPKSIIHFPTTQNQKTHANGGQGEKRTADKQ